MTLIMRKTGLESAAYAGDADYTVYSGKWAIGRIYEDRSTSQSFTGIGPCSDRTLVLT